MIQQMMINTEADSMKMEDAAKRAYDLLLEIERDEKGNPLTLEGAIRSVILKNPSMAQYRDDALGIIYCVLGSGISWRDGRLGDCTPNNYMNPPPQAGGQGCWSRDHGLPESWKTMEGASDECKEIMGDIRGRLQRQREIEIVEIKRCIVDIDSRCQKYRSDRRSWYPISWYACNLCAPAEAQQDFFNGAIETASLILKTDPPMGTEQWITHQRTKRYATEILEVLMGQQGVREANDGTELQQDAGSSEG